MQKDFIMKPKVDFCFKELMTDEEIRKGFLCALLDLSPEEVKETILLPTYLRKEHEDDKQGILDVRIFLNCDKQIDIEIQLLFFKFWEERTLFYLCKMFTSQIKEGESYGELGKCIHVGILDYVLFPEEREYYSRFHLKEDIRDFLYSDKLEIHVLELPKLTNHQYPENPLLNWAKFLHAEQKEELEAMAKTDKYIGKAYEKLVHISADEEKRLEYEAREKALRDYNHQMKYSFKDGWEQGRLEGIEAMILDNEEEGISKERILGKLQKRFSLSYEKALEYYTSFEKRRDKNDEL